MTILVTLQAQLIVGEAQVIKSLAPEGMLASVSVLLPGNLIPPARLSFG